MGEYWIARPRRHWYVVCRSHELTTRPLARRIFDTPVVVFRNGEGHPATLLDRCAHRNAPLSEGRVEDGLLACRYHGWQYDSSGRCRLIPTLGHNADGSGRGVEAFATREQDGFVWTYATSGEEPRSEPFRLPHTEDKSYASFIIDYRCEGTLHATLENMLDVPHTAYLHRGLFRGGPLKPIEAILRRRPGAVEAEYIGEPPPKGLAARILGLGGQGGGTLEHFDRFLVPSISQVEYRLGGSSHIIATSLLTPVSDFLTVFSTVISYRLPVPAWLTRLMFRPVVKRIFAQDAAIVGKQTRTVREFGSERYSSTNADLLGPEIWKLLREAEDGHAAAGDGGDWTELRRTGLSV